MGITCAVRGLSCFGLGCLGDGFIGQHFLFSWTVILVLLCSVQFSELELGFPRSFLFYSWYFCFPYVFFRLRFFLIYGLVVNLEPNSGTCLFANRFCCNLLMVTERIMLLVVLSEFFYENALRVPRR